MIDKIECRLSMTATFRPEIQKLLRQIDCATGNRFMRSSRFYIGVGDLRPLGIDALLHYHCKQGNKGAHKLEMLDTGSKPYRIMLISRCFVSAMEAGARGGNRSHWTFLSVSDWQCPGYVNAISVWCPLRPSQ